MSRGVGLVSGRLEFYGIVGVEDAMVDALSLSNYDNYLVVQYYRNDGLSALTLTLSQRERG